MPAKQSGKTQVLKNGTRINPGYHWTDVDNDKLQDTDIDISVADALKLSVDLIDKTISPTEAVEEFYHIYNHDQHHGFSPTADQETEAAEITTYFSHRLFMQRLSGDKEFTRWEQGVINLFEDPSRKLKKAELGLVITLPRFYRIRKTKGRLAQGKESLPEPYMSSVINPGDPIKLRFLEKYIDQNSRKNNLSYVFVNENNIIVEYAINRVDSTKTSMLDYILDKNDNELKVIVNNYSSQRFTDNTRCIRVSNMTFIA